MANRYLVVSDLHLSDVEDNPDGWKAYKGSRWVFDDELDRLVRRFLDEGDADDKRVLVLNGDVFDFDLVTAVPEDPPWPVRGFDRPQVPRRRCAVPKTPLTAYQNPDYLLPRGCRTPHRSTHRGRSEYVSHRSVSDQP